MWKDGLGKDLKKSRSKTYLDEGDCIEMAPFSLDRILRPLLKMFGLTALPIKFVIKNWALKAFDINDERTSSLI